MQNPNYLNALNTQPGTGWSESGDSAANAAVTVTHAATNGMVHYVTDVEVYIRGAAAGADITVDLKDGTTIKFGAVIGNGSATGAVLRKTFARPLRMTRSTAVSVVVSAGGAAVVSRANLIGYTDRK